MCNKTASQTTDLSACGSRPGLTHWWAEIDEEIGGNVPTTNNYTGFKSQNKIIRAFLMIMLGRIQNVFIKPGVDFNLDWPVTIRQTTKNQIFENNLSGTQIILQFLLLFRHQFNMENYYIWNLSFQNTEKMVWDSCNIILIGKHTHKIQKYFQ